MFCDLSDEKVFDRNLFYKIAAYSGDNVKPSLFDGNFVDYTEFLRWAERFPLSVDNVACPDCPLFIIYAAKASLIMKNKSTLRLY